MKPSIWIFWKLWQSFSILFKNFGTFISISLILGVISVIINILFWFLSFWWTIDLVMEILKQLLQFIIYILWILITSKIIIDIINNNTVNALPTVKEISKNAFKYLKITFSFWIKAYKVALVIWILLILAYIFLIINGSNNSMNTTLWIILSILLLILAIILFVLSIKYFAWSYIIFDKKIKDWKKLEEISSKIWRSRRWTTFLNLIVVWILIAIIYSIILGVIYSIFPHIANINNIGDIKSLLLKFWAVITIWLIIIQILWFIFWEIIVIYIWLLYKQYDNEESNKNNKQEVTKTEEL